MKIAPSIWIWALVLAVSWSALAGFAGLLCAVVIGFVWGFVFESPAPVRRLFGLTLLAAAIALVIAGSLAFSKWGERFSSTTRDPWLNGLKHLSLAIHNYENSMGHFPPPFTLSPDGKHRHSWRAAILPYLDLGVPHSPKYDFSQAWNSPANLAVLEKLQGPFARSDWDASYLKYVTPRPPPGETSFFAVVDEATMWRPDGRPVTQAGVQNGDGTDNTILLIAAPGRGVLWTEPRDLTIDEAIEFLTKPESRKGRYFVDHWFYVESHTAPWRATVSMVNAHGHNFSALTPERARALLTRAGREDVLAMKASSRQTPPNQTEVFVKWDRIWLTIVTAWPIIWLGRKRRIFAAETQPSGEIEGGAL